MVLLDAGSLFVYNNFINKGTIMAKPQQSATELSRTLAGQWSKSEKRAEASRQIMASKKRTHEINKAIRQAAILAK
jgi:hypothetical protein